MQFDVHDFSPQPTIKRVIDNTPEAAIRTSGQGMPSLDATFPDQSKHSVKFGADFSPSRAHLPVFFSSSAASHDTEQPVVVLANAGGQLANARGYHDPLNQSFASIVIDHERLVGPHALLFTGSEDTFVVASATETRQQTQNILNAIRATALKASITLASSFELPETIDSWLQSRTAPEALLPLTVESHLFTAFQQQYTAGTDLLAMSTRNAEAYRKDAVERLWGDAGLPLLESVYLSPQDIRENGSALVAALQRHFKAFDSLVLARVDGSGGYGIGRVAVSSLTASILESTSGGETLQVQGYVPLISSPCIIGTVAADHSRVLHVSEQVFSKFGTHSGNTWSRGFASQLRDIAPEYELIATEAFERLREAGIFGQVNIDVMICTRDTQEQLGLPSNVFLREANIRPAGSSIMLRLRDGLLPGGEPVDKIHTVQNIPIQKAVLNAGLLPDYLETFEQPGTTIVLTNYNYNTESAQLALLCCSDVSSMVLKQLEERLRNG